MKILDLHLENKYFPWNKKNIDSMTFWWKGEIFHKNALKDWSDIISHLHIKLISPNVDFKEFKDILIEYNGSFAIVIETPYLILCIVDRLRSIPLFYAKTEDAINISDNANYIQEKIRSSINEKNAVEFLIAGYVTGNETLLKDIMQIPAGEFIFVKKDDGTLIRDYYFRLEFGPFYALSEDELIENLYIILNNVFDRLIQSTVKKGKTLIVPLSGGLDSRIVIAMLKRLGVRDVICYTYGKKNDIEVKVSREVAENVGYRWYFVEYNNQKLFDCYHSEEMKDFLKYSGNFASLPHIQDFLAVKELSEFGIISQNSVFIPGITMDVSSACVPKNYLKPQKYDFEKFLNDNINLHYNLWPWKGIQEIFEILKQKNSTSHIKISNNETCAEAIIAFYYHERHAKFIGNSVRVYEFFGFDWRILGLDSEFNNFFSKVPYYYKIEREEKIYQECARKKIFINELTKLNNIYCTRNKFNAPKGIYNKLKFICIQYSNYVYKKIFNWKWGRLFKHPIINGALLKYIEIDYKDFCEFKLIENIIQNKNKNHLSITSSGYLALQYLHMLIKNNNDGM